ncbi:MAG: U32 family peptidase [Candidatus Margulisbacteria bacterium]|nr:U32 family peptidase [Candidatus Margulisiibacteriota bacterium]
MRIPELLIPAGNLEKLRTAVRFGADAVYIGGADFSLRTSDSGFSLEEVEIGVRFAHERGVKVYLALNIFPYDVDIEQMITYIEKTIPLGIDAVIVSDPGIIQEIQQRSLGIKIHLSTQANTTNAKAVQFWANQGVSRVVLARELNLLQIAEIKEKVPQVEIETFIHGAMCMSYSGRCLLSKYFTGRDANHGECAHPCRWKYYLTEESSPERKLEVEASEQGTYILNAKDLCMIQYIPELIKAEMDSFKIEGRMKSAYYVAMVTKIYRQAIDLFCCDPENYVLNPDWLQELENVSHRPYSTGFFFGDENNDLQQKVQNKQNEESSAYIKKYDFVGTVIDYNLQKKMILVQARNRISLGDKLDIIDPHRAEIMSIDIEQIENEKGEKLTEAHNQYTVNINCPFEVTAYSLLRVPREKISKAAEFTKGRII